MTLHKIQYKSTIMKFPLIIMPLRQKNHISPESPNYHLSFSSKSRSSTSQSRSSMIVTPNKYCPGKNIDDIFYAPTDKVPPLIKYTRKVNKPHYEGS